MTHGGADHGETENIRFNEIHAFNTIVKFCMSKKSVGLASKLKLLSHGQKEEKVEAAQPWAEGGERPLQTIPWLKSDLAKDTSEIKMFKKEVYIQCQAYNGFT